MCEFKNLLLEPWERKVPWNAAVRLLEECIEAELTEEATGDFSVHRWADIYISQKDYFASPEREDFEWSPNLKEKWNHQVLYSNLWIRKAKQKGIEYGLRVSTINDPGVCEHYNSAVVFHRA